MNCLQLLPVLTSPHQRLPPLSPLWIFFRLHYGKEDPTTHYLSTTTCLSPFHPMFSQWISLSETQILYQPIVKVTDKVYFVAWTLGLTPQRPSLIQVSRICNLLYCQNCKIKVHFLLYLIENYLLDLENLHFINWNLRTKVSKNCLS